MSVATDKAARLAELIREAGSVVALTGAGISVPSGIPDFRSPGTGLWRNVNPMEVAHIDVFRRDPERFWHFYGERFQTLEDKRPNRAHESLARLEEAGLLVRGDHAEHRPAPRARRLARADRGARDDRALLLPATCRGQYPLAEVRGGAWRTSARIPRCDCGEPLKPDVVLFGEYLPADALARAEQLAAGAELMLCIGSSLEVYPVAQLPAMTLARGGAVAILTQGATPFDSRAAVRLGGDVVDELDAVLAALELA